MFLLSTPTRGSNPASPTDQITVPPPTPPTGGSDPASPADQITPPPPTPPLATQTQPQRCFFKN
jgi:hypothetical protein